MMCKKASELKSFEELNLSEDTLACLQNQRDTISNLVLEARVLAYERETGISTMKLEKFKVDFINALSEAGFIMPAFYMRRTLRVRQIYAIADMLPSHKFHSKSSNHYLNNEIRSLSYDGLLTNEAYEAFQPLSAGEINSFVSAIRKILSPREFEVVMRYFGLLKSNSCTYADIANSLGISRACAREHKEHAISKLSNRISTLPKLFYLPGLSNAIMELGKIDHLLRKEIDEMEDMVNSYAVGLIYRERDIRLRLNRYKSLPYKSRRKEYRPGPEATILAQTALNPRCVNRLRRVGITTVADVLQTPPDCWFKIRDFGKTLLSDLTSFMHEIGYKDFNPKLR